MRLDIALAARGLVATRARARDLIRRGLVQVSGRTVTKAGAPVGADDTLAVSGTEAGYVARSAEKLVAALDAFGFDPSGRIALDVGASTGGFTQMLLACGASRVYAADVGHGQLHESLAADPRVVDLEGRGARDLTCTEVSEDIGAITVDVSFISLRLVLPHVMAFAASGGWLVALVKPQFEVGRDAIGKGGIVRDEAAQARAVAAVRDLIEAQPGWRTLEPIPSPLRGQGGNREYLLGARHG